MYSHWPITSDAVNKNQSELKADTYIRWQARENGRVTIFWAHYPYIATDEWLRVFSLVERIVV